MANDKADLIRLLESELDFIESGGYSAPSREPNKTPPMFYHSLICINHWQVPDHESECHEDCVLMHTVPQQHQSAALPCHYIPLNEAGDTVQSLEAKGNRAQLEEAVKGWLRKTIERLKAGEDVLGVSDVKY